MLGDLGKYRLDTRLGGGGMAEVFTASIQGAEGFSRRVAIKRVLPGYSENPQFSQMFVAEAQISSRMQHPNIVSVLDFDRDHEGRLFLVMELIEGKDLDALLATGLLPFSVVIYVMTEMLQGLGYAHDLPAGDDEMHGIVHRDVSPHNVLLSWEGAVKVSDFGIAKARAASEATASVFIKGKPAYMSPEQANGEPLDGRSDLFAVGVIMWEMLVGRRLFVGGDTRSLLAQVLFSPIPRPRQQRADVPRDLDRICMKLLERELPARYPSGEEVVEDLLRCEDAPRGGSKELVTLLAQRFGSEVPQRSSKRLAARPPSGIELAMATPLRFKPVAPGQSLPSGPSGSHSVPSTQLGHAAAEGYMSGCQGGMGAPGSMASPMGFGAEPAAAGAMPSAMGIGPGSYGAQGSYGAPGSVDQMMSASTRTLPPSPRSTGPIHPPRRGVSAVAIMASIVGGLIVAGVVLGVVLSQRGGTSAQDARPSDAGLVAMGGRTAGGGAPTTVDAGGLAPPTPDASTAVSPQPAEPDAGIGGKTSEEKPENAPVHKRGKGKLTITSEHTPYEVFNKGKSLGGTPLTAKELAAGTYRLKFVSGDGDAMYRTVKIDAGKESKLAL